jgi:hypothetical protein
MNRWHVDVLRAGDFRLDGGGMFGLIPKVQWSTWVEADADNRIPLACNALLLRDGARTVLVETGYGDRWSDADRAAWLLARRTVVDALAELGGGHHTVGFGPDHHRLVGFQLPDQREPLVDPTTYIDPAMYI